MVGILSDYKDITDRYLNGKIDFQEYSKLFEERSKELEEKEHNTTIDIINRKIISNN